jgi:hypothetical protein
MISPPPAPAALFTGAGGQGKTQGRRINFSTSHKKNKTTKEK